MTNMTQKEILDRLRAEGKFTANKTTFIDGVNRGNIPYHYIEGSKKKRYSYRKVVNALAKCGIGKPLSIEDRIERLPDPEPEQSVQEYGQVISELDSTATITDANIYKTIYQGKLEKLKYDKEQGTVVLQADVENKAFAVARSLRDKILSQPERLANELATMNNAHEIKELLYKEANVLLDGFSEDSFL